MPYIKRDLFNRLSRIGNICDFYVSVWRLRVGDFRSYEEAGNALIQLKKEFPQMAREMRVVRDKIHIQIHQGFTE